MKRFKDMKSKWALILAFVMIVSVVVPAVLFSATDNVNAATGKSYDKTSLSYTGTYTDISLKKDADFKNAKYVSSSDEIINALQSAKAGDVIIIKGGTYKFSTSVIVNNTINGQDGSYIIVKAEDNHDVKFDFSAQVFNSQNRGFILDGDYWYFGGINFYGRKEIKDVLAYLKTIENGRDDLAVRRIINVPKRGIGATTINRVQEYANTEDMSFYDALRVAGTIPGVGKSVAKLDGFVQMIQTMRSKQPYYSVKELIEDVLEQTEYRKELMAEGTEEALDRLANIDELLNKAASYAEHADNPSLGGFLEEVALVADIDNLEEDADHVVMMTLHSAKGLEFPVVFMVGMEDGMFPSYMSISSEDPADLEEERRLCYVGITRAKETLILTSARQRMVRGEIHYNRVSRFIEDIPKEVLAENETANVQPKEKKERPETKAHAAYRQMRETFKTKAFAQPQVEAKKEGGLSYDVGDRVRHIKFGVGSVTDIREGGRDYEVTVNFDRVGVKKMFASFAKLTKVEG